MCNNWIICGVPNRKPINIPPPQKHYKIVFIKAPTPPAPTAPVIPVFPQNEEKTLVYVLVKKPEEQPDIVIPTPAPTQPSKPEVYFIRYKTQVGGIVCGDSQRSLKRSGIMKLIVKLCVIYRNRKVIQKALPLHQAATTEHQDQALFRPAASTACPTKAEIISHHLFLLHHQCCCKYSCCKFCILNKSYTISQRKNDRQRVSEFLRPSAHN